MEAEADESPRPGVVSLAHAHGHTHAGVGWRRAAALPGGSYNKISDPLALEAPRGNAALNGTPVCVEAC